ncbi:MAG TPA: bifunctional DNA-formamidopyrimidine glycosylase/DNA-(apurinic or apyrimidinic site) lyase [Pyrinomonadaceae bacterium]|nr:bifunctional DNA-formamidopyrimidine glycosylase/DNA-(apurinic or apyrimidinic site) lyase [Pyrinomonadaceae bacterium]
MPELPEVDLVTRTLDRFIAGRTIADAVLIRQRLAPDSSPAKFRGSLKNATVTSVTRRGKHILIELDNGKTLIVHLRMSGRFSLLDADDTDPKFTHAVLYFSDNTRLTFDDQRHFGLMKIVKTKDVHLAKEIAKLAPEPFADEFTADYLIVELKRANRVLKEFLLDQTKVTGLGNIYAAEAMFAAGIHPAIRTNNLSKPRTIRLFEQIVDVLRNQIELSKIGEPDPKVIDGRYFADNATRQWLVYDREGQPCINCNSPIVRLKQSGRSTYFCKICQRR